MNGREVHCDSNVWSAAERSKKANRLMLMLGLNEDYVCSILFILLFVLLYYYSITMVLLLFKKPPNVFSGCIIPAF